MRKHLDENDALHDQALDALLEAAEQPLVCSLITLAEILVGPARAGRLRDARAAIADLDVVEIPLGDDAATRLVTTDLLGKPLFAQVPYENADGSPVTVDRDFCGNPRDRARPTPGPFERPGRGEWKLRVR